MSDSSNLPIDPSRTALVLSSSFLGVYAHAGFLNALTERSLGVSRIAGCSAGALAGALYACGMRRDELKRVATGWPLKWSFFDFGCLWRLPGLMTSLGSTGLFSGRNTVRRLRELLGERDLSDLPLDIAVTNLTTGASEIRRSGPLAETVMASCAVPGLFTAQRIGNERFLDGGISAGVPFHQFIRDDSIDTILIHRVRRATGNRPVFRMGSMARLARSSHYLACRELYAHRLDLAKASGKRVIEAITICPFPGIISQRKAPICYDLGHATGSSLQLFQSAENQ